MFMFADQRASGGMGLTGGIADVGSLYDSLVGIHTGRADADAILDRYDEVRRRIWRDVVNPVSSDNMRRLIDLDPDTAVEKDPFFAMLKQMETGPPPPPPPGEEGGGNSVSLALVCTLPMLSVAGLVSLSYTPMPSAHRE